MRATPLALAIALGWVACAPTAPLIHAPVDIVITNPPAANRWSMSQVLPLDVPVWIDPRFTAEERADIETAEADWTRAAGGCVRFVAGDGVQIIRVDGVNEFPTGQPDGTVALWDAEHARMWIAPSAFCHFTVCTIARQMIAAHELGHLLGLEHSDEPGTCMRATANWRCGIESGIPWVDAWAFCVQHGGCSCPVDMPALGEGLPLAR